MKGDRQAWLLIRGNNSSSRLLAMGRPMAGLPPSRAFPTAWRYGGSARMARYRMRFGTRAKSVGGGSRLLRLAVHRRMEESPLYRVFPIAWKSGGSERMDRCRELSGTKGDNGSGILRP